MVSSGLKLARVECILTLRSSKGNGVSPARFSEKEDRK